MSNAIKFMCALALACTTVPTHATTPMLAAGGMQSFAVQGGGALSAWGANDFSQLGDGTTVTRASPTQLAGLSGAVSAASGVAHALLLKNDGSVWGWGNNSYGQVGDNTNASRTAPVLVGAISGEIAVNVSAGDYHSLALMDDGSIHSWGLNSSGQLGNGTTTNLPLPLAVSGIANATAIAAGACHSLALKGDGTVWAWGCNNAGQLGDYTATQRNTPVATWNLNDISAIAAGAYHSLALKKDGTVWAWGSNNAGQLGEPASTPQRITPVQVAGLSGVVALAAGFQHSLALKRDGTVWAWGGNDSGQLGDGSLSDRPAPVRAAGLDGTVALAAGYRHSLALRSDGTVRTWGNNSFGQLGDGSTTFRTAPAPAGALNLGASSNAAPQNGWWWNPAESGRGFVIETRNNKYFLASYLYADDGRATWVVASGPVTRANYLQGRLLAYANGQTLTGTYRSPLQTASPGMVTLSFSDASHATLTWPGGSVPLQRFEIVPGGLAAPPAAFQPESGWWWNASESGRGFALEIQNGSLFLGGYMYDWNGNPVWYVSSGALARPDFYQGNWILYGNGQTLTGAYRPPVELNPGAGSVALQFSGTQTATLTLPDGRQIPLTRFQF